MPTGLGTVGHLRQSLYFEKPIPRMGGRQGISVVRATTEVGQAVGWLEGGPLTWIGGAQETLLSRGARVLRKT